MKEKYYIKNIKSWKYLDWYMANTFELDDLWDVANMKYSSLKEAEWWLLREDVEWFFKIVKVYIK